MKCQDCFHCDEAKKQLVWDNDDCIAFECPATGEYSFTYWEACPSFRRFQPDHDTEYENRKDNAYA